MEKPQALNRKASNLKQIESCQFETWILINASPIRSQSIRRKYAFKNIYLLKPNPKPNPRPETSLISPPFPLCIKESQS